jgi:hypothetical protein
MSNANDSGFALPTPADVAPAAAQQASSVAVPPDAANPALEPMASRDLVIGAGVLLVLWVAFFFAKNHYVHSLVSKRVPPSKAESAGWWLFVMLASLSLGVVLVAVNASRFMTPLVLGPLGAVSSLSLVLMLMSRRK